ncbi:MAG TPA: carboxypeptidase regulatory-like domain-containing protein [Dongiaceae bacterium]|nr:carboxypeptidase regulatory-like domain-containing protein [Dongiaceae bacterium]
MTSISTGLFKARRPGVLRHLMLALAGLAFAASIGSRSLAQTSSTGAIAGQVSDAKGGVVAGASVKVINESTLETTTLASQSNGAFLAPLLAPGRYKVEIAKPGFKTLVRSGIIVAVTETAQVNLQIDVGLVTETIEVNAQADVLNTQDAALGHVTDGQMVRDLPLVNRNYTQIVGLSPGVVADVNNASDLGRGNSGLNAVDGGFSAHGGATNDNNYQMNGSQVNDLMAAGSFSGGVPIPNPDSIEEFKVQTSQYDAAYGRNAGANVNVVTKTGTNEFHGTVFEFVRNNIFNANDFFLNSNNQPRADLKQNQFGFSLGGPIVKEKLFFFSSYQGTRQINGLDSTAACLSTFITPPELAGMPDRSATTLGAAFAGKAGAFGIPIAPDGSNISPEALALFNLKLTNGNYLIPAPQNTSNGQSSITQNCTYNDDQFILGADYEISPRSRLSASFFYDNGAQNATFPSSLAPMLPGFSQPINTSFRNFSINYTTTINPHFVNQVVFGYNRLNNMLVQSEPLVTTAGSNTPIPFSYSAIGVNAAGNDNTYPGIAVVGQWDLGGNGQGASVIQNNYNLYDSVSYLRGKHSFRFGGGLSQQLIDFTGFHFVGLTANLDTIDFLEGYVLESQDFIGVPDRNWTGKNIDLYAQDDIRLTSRFNLNLGVRYERQGVLGDSGGRASIFNIALADPNPPASGSVAGYTVASNFLGTPPPGVVRAKTSAAINGDGQNAWAPRIGFAWQLPRTNRFVLRGGYGIFYTRTTGQPFLQLLASPPYGLIQTQLIVPFSDPFPVPQATFPFYPPYSATTFPQLTPTTFAADFRPPMVQSYSLNLQSQLASNLVLEIGYEGSRGTHLLQNRLFNQALSASAANPVRGETENTLANLNSRLPIPGFNPAAATIIESAGNSSYNGLNVSLNKRFSHGLQLLASYTWARSLTAANGYSTGPNGAMLVGNQNDPRSRYGPDAFVRPQRFIASFVYELPNLHSDSGAVKRFTNGWSLSGVVTIQSGQYLTITDANTMNAFGIASPMGDRPELVSGCTPGQVASKGSVTKRIYGYFNSSCLTAPPTITSDGGTDFGNLPVGAVRGPAQNNVDLAILKRTPLPWWNEKFTLDFRTEFFNAFNTPQFSNPDLNAGSVAPDPSTGATVWAPSSSFGTIKSTSVNPRIIQLALKLVF